ncbi:MAG: M15 family metallopeptidase [bacterium]|nr:M15 family metallopeptidase [bacterium]
MEDIKKNYTRAALMVLGAMVIVIISGYGVYTYKKLTKINYNQQNKIIDLESSVALLSNDLFETKNYNLELLGNLNDEKTRNDNFENEISKLSGTVGTLEKLSKTDPELLQKYSKIYFLNEHYTPSSLTLIDEKYTFQNDKLLEVHSSVWPELEDLLNEAEDDKIDLRIISAYRSFKTQAALKSGYKVIYGAGSANQFSADQGYSEHQLGTTVDFTTPTLGLNFNGFASTEAYKWLIENAYKYGFILSYPKTNAFYQFEPWHWRFVGTELSKKLHDDSLNFYDLDQRDIDQYLVSIFD